MKNENINLTYDEIDVEKEERVTGIAPIAEKEEEEGEGE